MGLVRVTDLQLNMALAEDIRDINGRFLLAKGQQIEAEHIRILKIWGVSEVNIIGQGEGETALGAEIPLDPKILEKYEAETRAAFIHVNLNHPVCKELFRLSVAYRARNNNGRKKDRRPAWGHHPGKPRPGELNFERLLEGGIKLPGAPAIVHELNEIINDPYSSAHDIARVVSKSPGLTAVLLRIVNSPVYGFLSRVDVIPRAVAVIGTKEITTLAMGISILSSFQGIPKNLLDMGSFLKHSLACGIITRILSTHKNLLQTEQLFASGLLHDIGRLVFFKYFPDYAGEVLARAWKSGNLLLDEEKTYLGFQHAEWGGRLLKAWKLPLTLERNITYHHAPARSPNPTHAALVHIADIIVHALGIDGSGEFKVPYFQENCWEALGLRPSILPVVVKQATHQLGVLSDVILNQEAL